MRKLIFAAAALAIANGSARAQDARPIELGIDAGITLGIGDDRGTDIGIPVQTFRAGFPLSARTSLEPKIGISIHTDGNTTSDYRAELGLLYHLGTSRYPGAYQRAGMYVRPFIGFSGVNREDAPDSNSGLIGIGAGYKFPIVSRLSSRFEANIAQHFGDDDFTEIGLLAGLSFFTR